MHHLTAIKCLILNSSYEPLRIVTWQKAIVLFFQGKVDIVEQHQIFARSVRTSFPLPSVLKLKTYVRPRSSNAIRFCRENVYIRDNYICQYCREKHTTKSLTLDHVVPASHGGKKTWTNVVSACRDCNQKKANRTPNQAQMPLLNEPKSPQWLPITTFDLQNLPEQWVQYLTFKTG